MDFYLCRLRLVSIHSGASSVCRPGLLSCRPELNLCNPRVFPSSQDIFRSDCSFFLSDFLGSFHSILRIPRSSLRFCAFSPGLLLSTQLGLRNVCEWNAFNPETFVIFIAYWKKKKRLQQLFLTFCTNFCESSKTWSGAKTNTGVPTSSRSPSCVSLMPQGVKCAIAARQLLLRQIVVPAGSSAFPWALEVEEFQTLESLQCGTAVAGKLSFHFSFCCRTARLSDHIGVESKHTEAQIYRAANKLSVQSGAGSVCVCV